MTTIHDQVREFHEVFEHPIGTVPRVPEEARVRFRARIIAEEAFETLHAFFSNPMARRFLDAAATLVNIVIDECSVDVDMPELADGMADLDYVVEGCRIEFGIDGESVAAEVHRSNMAKLFACDMCLPDPDGPHPSCTKCGGRGKVVRKREDGKTLKPSGWTPPDIERVLNGQGWTP